MATYKKFEDLPVWQNARKFAAHADKIIENSGIRRNFKLRDQMLSSSGSVMDNIAEGFERNGNREFIQFLYIAKGSAGEFRSQLYRALDAERIAESEFNEIKSKIEGISQEIQNFLNYLHTSDKRGVKYSHNH
jgi:four helix bundle protein